MTWFSIIFYFKIDLTFILLSLSLSLSLSLRFTSYIGFSFFFVEIQVSAIRHHIVYCSGRMFRITISKVATDTSCFSGRFCHAVFANLCLSINQALKAGVGSILAPLNINVIDRVPLGDTLPFFGGGEGGWGRGCKYSGYG